MSKILNPEKFPYVGSDALSAVTDVKSALDFVDAGGTPSSPLLAETNDTGITTGDVNIIKLLPPLIVVGVDVVGRHYPDDSQNMLAELVEFDVSNGEMDGLLNSALPAGIKIDPITSTRLAFETLGVGKTALGMIEVNKSTGKYRVVSSAQPATASSTAYETNQTVIYKNPVTTGKHLMQRYIAQSALSISKLGMFLHQSVLGMSSEYDFVCMRANGNVPTEVGKISATQISISMGVGNTYVELTLPSTFDVAASEEFYIGVKKVSAVTDTRLAVLNTTDQAGFANLGDLRLTLPYSSSATYNACVGDDSGGWAGGVGYNYPIHGLYIASLPSPDFPDVDTVNGYETFAKIGDKDKGLFILGGTNQSYRLCRASQREAAAGSYSDPALVGAEIPITIEPGALSGKNSHNHTEPTRVTTTPYTVLISDEVLFVDTDVGIIVVNLPAGISSRSLEIINCGSSGNDITLTPDGSEKINGVAATVAITDGNKLRLTFETTEQWW